MIYTPYDWLNKFYGYVAGVVKVGVVDVDISISSHLKEEVTWATGKQLQVISTIIIIFKSFILLRS